MTYPLMILAACAVLVGLIFGPSGLFEHHLAQTPQLHALQAAEGMPGHVAEIEPKTDWLTIAVGTMAAITGLAISFLFYFQANPWPARMATGFRPLYNASSHKFYVDEIYDRLIVWPTRLLALAVSLCDKYLIAMLVQGLASFPGFVGRTFFGPRQNGLIQYYAGWTALTLAILLLVLFQVY